jgi:hypothetical protein
MSQSTLSAPSLESSLESVSPKTPKTPKFTPLSKSLSQSGSFKSPLSKEKSKPDFDAIHENYSKAIVRGRHPNSFKKESELWHHFRTSDERFKSIAKGKGLWQVIEETNDSNEEYKLLDTSDDERDNYDIEDDMSALEHMQTNNSQHLLATANNAAPVTELNGIQVDLKVWN